MTIAVAEITGVALTPEDFSAVVNGCQPILLRKLIDHWPAVAAGRRSPVDFREKWRLDVSSIYRIEVKGNF